MGVATSMVLPERHRGRSLQTAIFLGPLVRISSSNLEAFFWLTARAWPDHGSAKQKKLKGLILAQNERWRRGLGMQVERVPRKGESGERDSNT